MGLEKKELGGAAKNYFADRKNLRKATRIIEF